MATKYVKGLKIDGASYGFIPPAPTETTAGGIKAKARTNENTEVVIDSTSGKAYVGVSEIELATATKIGGIKANPVTNFSNDPVRIETNGQLKAEGFERFRNPDSEVGENSVARGESTEAYAEASGKNSFALYGEASGDNSIAIHGMATGENSVAVMDGDASGDNSMAIMNGIANGENSFALGGCSNGKNSISIFGTDADGDSSIAINGGIAYGENSIAIEGETNEDHAIAINGGEANGKYSVAIGGRMGSPISAIANEEGSFAIGGNAKAEEVMSIAFLQGTTKDTEKENYPGDLDLTYGQFAGPFAHAGGCVSAAFGNGYTTKAGAFAAGGLLETKIISSVMGGNYRQFDSKPSYANGASSIAVGLSVSANGTASQAFGDSNIANGAYSLVHGSSCKTSKEALYSHAEGGATEAQASWAHAEGSATFAKGECTHTEGCGTIANPAAKYSHAEGDGSQTFGIASHAEGHSCWASGKYSHAEGNFTVAAGESQHVIGTSNLIDSDNKYAYIIGNGYDTSGHEGTVGRSNALTVDWEGNLWTSGKIRYGGTSWNDGTEIDLNNYYTKTQADENFITKEDGLPKVTEEDNGKILQVVNGKWALVKISNGNEVSY